MATLMKKGPWFQAKGLFTEAAEPMWVHARNSFSVAVNPRIGAGAKLCFGIHGMPPFAVGRLCWGDWVSVTVEPWIGARFELCLSVHLALLSLIFPTFFF